MTGNNSCGTRSIRYGIMRDNVLAIDAILADGAQARFARWAQSGSGLRLVPLPLVGRGRGGGIPARRRDPPPLSLPQGEGTLTVKVLPYSAICWRWGGGRPNTLPARFRRCRGGSAAI